MLIELSLDVSIVSYVNLLLVSGDRSGLFTVARREIALVSIVGVNAYLDSLKKKLILVKSR